MPMTFRTGRPTRRPYPYDVEWAGVGLMLGHKDKDGGELVTSKPQDQANVVPTDYGYDAQNPIIEAVNGYNDLSRGYGTAIQQSKDDRTYRYCLGVDASVAGQVQPGPALNNVVALGAIDATNGVKRSFDLNGQTYYLNGRYCQVKSAGINQMTVAKDFGAGQVASDVTVFQSNLPGGGTYAYVAMGDNCAVWRAGPQWQTQTLIVSGTPTGGSFVISYAGNQTIPILWINTEAAIQAEIVKLPGLQNATVTRIAGFDGTTNKTYLVTLTGVVSPTLLSVTDNTTGGTHSVVLSTTTAYAAVVWTQRVSEQTITITLTPTTGSYTLQYGTQVTGSIAYNATAATIQTAIRALIGLGSVTVTSIGDSPNYTHTIRFEGVNDTATTLVQNKDGFLDATWTLATTRNVLKARSWVMSGRDFYRGHSINLMAKVDTDADPFLEENWTAPNAFRVGDQNAGITRLVVTTGGVVVVLKTDGMWTLDQSGQDYQLFPFLRTAFDPNSGDAVGQWVNDLYVAYAGATYKLSPAMGLTEVGPEKLTDNDTPVHGSVTAICGHDNFNLYAGLYNPDTGNSYLLKYGSWMLFNPAANMYSAGQEEAKRLDAWHGSITQAFVGKKITLLNRSEVDAPTGHQIMTIGFSDGTVQNFVLPCVPNPLGCSSYRWTSTDGTLYLPVWHGLFQADPKSLRAVTVTSMTNNQTSFVEYQYQIDKSGTFSTLGDFTSIPRKKYEFPADVGGVLLDQAVILKSASTTSPATFLGLALHYQLRTALYQVYEFYVLAEDNLIKRNGTPMRIGARSIRTLIESYAGAVDPVTKQQDVRSIGSFTLYLPDETAKQVAVVGYEQTMAWDYRTRKFRSAIKVRATDVTFSSVNGTYDRLAANTYGLLEAYTYAQLETL